MRETKNLEFKEKVSNTFLKTVSAYANYGTGKIINIKTPPEIWETFFRWCQNQ